MENTPMAPAAQALAPAVSEIRALLETSHKNVAQQVNQELLSTYWKIGEVIVRYEQNDSVRAAYGEKTLLQLSKALTKELGRGGALQSAKYASVIFELPNLPDGVWQIELVALLRAAVHLR